ncbi:polycystic kidney disease protein 1-like 2 isoform X2 [Amphibalanus amphitrite]|nr:polycystic kidney disease protein 1-like 2 isoform X2 [Amphibalanus amphitrite]XP_043193605.1 polycystic kidney disease protein 1-like 2 isoform X2 [Amphibalanus amphitrite]
MGEHLLKAKEMHARFIEDTETTMDIESEDDGVMLVRGWLTPRTGADGVEAAETPTTISALYRDDALNTLQRAVICTPNMTFHDCERHKHVRYNLTMFAGRCMYWSENLTAFTDQGCEVGPLSTVDVLHCRCSHLTDFAGSFLVLPNRLDVTMVVDMNMMLSQNPTALYWMGVLLLIFLLLLVYARKQDQRDVKRRNIIYVDDNDPRHRYAYLVTVYTGVQYKAGTSAHVAMFLTGEKGSSNTHLLTGEKKRKRTLERGSDSWFLITTHGSLGDLTELHIWHDNSGSNPEWFLERVLVRDCQTDSVWVFLVGRWVHPVTGLLVTVRPAALHEVTAWNTSFARRAEESLRDGHLWFSVFSRPLSSSFTRCQRLACAMTLLMVNLLVSLMFYGVPTGDASDQISRSQSFGLDWYDIVISAESALLVGLLVTPIIVLFRRSEPLTDEQVRTLVTDNDQGHSQTGAKETGRSAVASPAIVGGAPTENTGAEASADIAEMQERVGGGALPLPDKRRGCMLPWWCIYVAWMLAALTMLFSGVLCLAYSAQFGALKCYIWLVSSGVSVLQSVIFIQPLIIVGASLLASWCCQAAPEVENRSEERPAHAAMNADIAEEYAQAIHAKRTQPMYRQVPKRKLRKMRAKKMKDLLTHEAIRDIATFLAYIACLLVIIHGNKDPNAFYSTMTARNLFVEGGAVAGDDDAVTLEDAKELGNVIHYLNTTLIRSLHKAEEYNGKLAVRNGMTRQDGLYLIGVARLRQVRVTRDACRPPDQLFWMNFTACKRPFLLKYEDTKNYGQGWSPEPHLHDDPWDNEATEAWIHKDADYLQTMSVQGKHALYPGSGYTLHLGRAKKASQVVLDYIEDTKWLDAYTKALFVEFTMYNADSDLFNLVVLLFEQSRAGTITPSFDIKTSKLYVDTHMNRLTIFMTIFYVFFIIFNTVVESRKIFRIGPKLYFRDMWSRLDFLLVVMGYVCVILYINRHIVLEKAFSKLRNTDENKFANFYIPVYWDYILTYAQAFALVLTMAKFWKILTFNKRMVTFSLTLRYSRKELRAFFIFFAIAVIGYAFWSNGLFGASLEDYQNMWSSIISLILFSIGTFDYDGYITTDRTFGAIFFVTYVFFVMIYLINVMLSIIMAGYEMAMDDMQHLVTKYDVVDVFIWEVRNFFEDSSSSSEDEGRMAAARTRQRRRVRELLRRLFPWCLDNARKRDLRRPVEQESMEQLQRFMSLTAAAGGKPPAPADQREGSVASAEDAELRAAAARGPRRVGMIEPEDVDEDEGAAPAAADQQPGHRFLLDEEDVAGGRRGHTRRRVSAAAERHRRRSRATTGRRHRGPPVPRRKSVQNDPHFLPSLTAEPEERPPAAAVAQNSSSAQRRQSTKRRVSGQRRASDRRRSSSRRRSSGPHRPPAPTSSARRRVSSGQRPSGGLQRAPAPRDPSQPSTSGLTRADLARLAGRSTAAPPQAQGGARPHVPTR